MKHHSSVPPWYADQRVGEMRAEIVPFFVSVLVPCRAFHGKRLYGVMVS
jgi:hypothetical protein